MPTTATSHQSIPLLDPPLCLLSTYSRAGPGLSVTISGFSTDKSDVLLFFATLLHAARIHSCGPAMLCLAFACLLLPL